jgi:hypothetical protein
MDVLRPGEGPLLCGQPTNQDTPCTHHEVEGLGACVWHMPDDLLEEAEEITGFRRCRMRFGGTDACHFAATKGTEPPRCKNHGANTGSYQSKLAAERVVEGNIADRLVVILADHGEKLMAPDPIGNPLAELLELAAEIKAFKEIMRVITAYLVQRQEMRHGHRVGEQLRAEVLLYERAQERLAKILVDISKLGIEARLAQIEENQAAMIERALNAALTASGLGLIEQQEARQVLHRETDPGGQLADGFRRRADPGVQGVRRRADRSAADVAYRGQERQEGPARAAPARR